MKLLKEYWNHPLTRLSRAVTMVELIAVFSTYLIYKTF